MLAARVWQANSATVAAVEGSFPCPINRVIDDDTLESVSGVLRPRDPRRQKTARSPGLVAGQAWRRHRAAADLVPCRWTNFFTYDRNARLHVFDADKVAGNSLRIPPRKAAETLMGLDDKEYTFSEA